MVDSKGFIDALKDRGFSPFIGVPCSLLKPLINYVIDTEASDFMIANNEGEALAIAAGAYMAGKKPVVMLQNSGLGNMVNPITSLNFIYNIPVLLIVTWRGEPGDKDEPQHELMGTITLDLLSLLRIGYTIFPRSSCEINEKIENCEQAITKKKLPFALVMKKNSVEPYKLTTRQIYCFRPGTVMTKSFDMSSIFLSRRKAIEQIVQMVDSAAAIVSTTGMISRELYFSAERPGNFYVVGSMGCASSIALGVALYRKSHPVIVLDGDGAALMRLEAMVSIGHYRPSNLIHVILDNMTYDSTGGQATLSNSVRFDQMAVECGYRTATSLVSVEELEITMSNCLSTDGPHLIHVRVLPGTEVAVGRPTLSSIEIKERFMSFLSRNGQAEWKAVC